MLEEARALGLDLADLIAAADSHPTAAPWPSSSPRSKRTFTPGTAATYRPYWRLAVEHHGDRRLADLGVADLHAVVEAAAERAQRNRPGATGRSSRETCIAALRAAVRRAVAAGLVTPTQRPRSPSPAGPDPDDGPSTTLEVAELIDAVRATSLDPALDLLLVRFHLETGARRSGGLALRVRPRRASSHRLAHREGQRP